METQPERDPLTLEPVLILPDITGMPVAHAVPVLNAILGASPGSVSIDLNGQPVDNDVSGDHRIVATQTPAYTGESVEISTIALTAEAEDPEANQIRMPNLELTSLIPAIAALDVLKAICAALNNGYEFLVQIKDEISNLPMYPPYSHSHRIRTAVPVKGGPIDPGDVVAVIVFDIGAGDKKKPRS